MKPTGKTATVLMSGGIDSAACAYLLRSQGLQVGAIFVDFGQAAAVAEAEAVIKVTTHLAIPLRKLVVRGPQAFGAGELTGRNAFLVFAALFFSGETSSLINLGIHSGTPYYDCSPSFLSSINRLVAEHTDGRVSVTAPFVDWTKKQIYEYFLTTDIPLESTYSCEAGTNPVCGLCGSCRDRRALGC
ncbi:7-cyano-7-deazaguanine synthase [Burkholderia pseudomallei]|uniref:7-cyano-7-deazaguanine synthase n=1 Tax=Burkholderia pseudomallei TaxID=28450 RepID=UPI000E6A05EB|nr:tRNA methyl transferase-like protein [Burkholderia pseudomallei]RIV44765.1 tRNA methyl transferase-like protein [Burkholderia pseudomallei]